MDEISSHHNPPLLMLLAITDIPVNNAHITPGVFVRQQPVHALWRASIDSVNVPVL
jgi:hypothetical protein